jgi:hypothetical protein
VSGWWMILLNWCWLLILSCQNVKMHLFPSYYPSVADLYCDLCFLYCCIKGGVMPERPAAMLVSCMACCQIVVSCLFRLTVQAGFCASGFRSQFEGNSFYVLDMMWFGPSEGKLSCNLRTGRVLIYDHAPIIFGKHVFLWIPQTISLGTF